MAFNLEEEKTILHKAIARAMANGWTLEHSGLIPLSWAKPVTLSDEILLYLGTDRIIYSEGFLRAFFGDEWEERRAEMLLEPSSLKYLEKFMPAD